MATKSDVAWKIITSTLKLAHTDGWRQLTLAAIAEDTGLGIDKVHETFASKWAILDGFNRRIDGEMLRGGIDEDGTVRDRLFELIMRRIDALAPHRDGIIAILRETFVVDPLASLAGLCAAQRSMGLALEAAGVSTTGPVGRARAQVLSAIYLRALLLWLRSEGGTTDKVMAQLDKWLAQAERFATSFPGRPRRDRRAPRDEATPSEPPQPA